MTRRQAQLIGEAALSPSVRGMTLRLADGEPLGHTAGQWVNLHVPVAGETAVRAYSIASPPGGPRDDRFELAVTRVEGGAGSSALHAISVGAMLEVDGPHGLFTRDGHDRSVPALFVGTGTGLAPLRAMVLDELERGDSGPLVVLFGCRTVADILWGGELAAVAAANDRLRFEVTLSRPDDCWAGRTGHVQSHLREVAAGLGRPHVYVCGLSKMVKDVRRILKAELGLERRLIHSERYD